MWERFWGHRAVTVCVPTAETFLFALVRDGKFIRYDFFPCTQEEGALAAVFQAARKAGYGKQIALAGGFSDFRMVRERLPDMTEDEVKETMYWNSDRLFQLEKEMVSDFRILTHSPEDYDILAAGAGADTLAAFSMAARESGCRIAWVVPLPFLFEMAAPLVVGLAGRSEAWLYVWNGTGWDKNRRIRKKEAGEDISRFLKGTGMENVVWLPTWELDEKAYGEWVSILEGNEQPPLKEWMLTLASRIPEGLLGINLALAEDRPTPFLSKENRTLRILQGLTACLLLVTVVLGVEYWMARGDRMAEIQRAGALSAVRAEMGEARRKREEAEAAQKEKIQFLEGAGGWETKLVLLADGLPSGISLQFIEKRGNGILIQGTADKSASVMALRSQIQTSWQWTCRVESDKKDQQLPLRRFILRAEEKKS